ncbi:MAG: response regulator [Anaerolineae bacterium]|nr:response regulator [Anaerolineae bacterium]
MESSSVVDVMLVEDNPQDAELIIRTLRKHNLANRLLHMKNGKDALDFLFGTGSPESAPMENKPRVILLDLKLPKIDGLEVLRIIKSDERTHIIPVVIVTSSEEYPDIQAAYILGAISFVVKPVKFDAFMNVMARLGAYWLQVNHPMNNSNKDMTKY